MTQFPQDPNASQSTQGRPARQDAPRWYPILPPMEMPPPPPPSGLGQCPIPQPPSRLSRVARLIILALLLAALAIGVLQLGPIIRFLEAIGDSGSKDPRAQIKGLAAFGLCMVCILAAVRIALNAGRGQ